MINLNVLLVFVALILTLASGVGKLPLWPAVFVLCLALLLQAWR